MHYYTECAQASEFRNKPVTYGAPASLHVNLQQTVTEKKKNRKSGVHRSGGLRVVEPACFQRSRIVALDPARQPRTMNDPSVALSGGGVNNDS
jgi:hypothetical protein